MLLADMLRLKLCRDHRRSKFTRIDLHRSTDRSHSLDDASGGFNRSIDEPQSTPKKPVVAIARPASRPSKFHTVTVMGGTERAGTTLPAQNKTFLPRSGRRRRRRRQLN
jgi:hypothetical protein